MIYYNGQPCGYAILNVAPKKPKSDKNYLYFQAEENGATVWFETYTGSSYQFSLEISTDGETWNQWGSTTSGTYRVFNTITLEKLGDYVFVRAVGTNTWPGDDKSHFLMGDKKIACGGNIMSMKKNNLEYYSTSNSSFRRFFEDCTSLTTPPELPASAITTYCYAHMFDGCTSLVTAPELPATTLASYCYEHMFYYCSFLNYVKVYATSWDTNKAGEWLYFVSGNGTFVKPNGVTITSGSSGIPVNWEVINF